MAHLNELLFRKGRYGHNCLLFI